MSDELDKERKKEIMKDIILKLHKGLSVEEAKEKFEKEIGEGSSTEIAEMEQSLINEGLSPEEIKKFCNVHALFFQSALEKSVSEEPSFQENKVSLPTGRFTLNELMSVLNTLPVDITFVDKEDRVRYFSDSKQRVFVRTKSVLGRKVQNCHPPQSVDVVEKLLKSFKEGKRDSADFWIDFKGKSVYIRYFAVRDRKGHYLGTLEVTQDIKGIQELEGEKRLLDERD